MTRVIFTEANGNGVGIYEDAPVPDIGATVISEGATFFVKAVVLEYHDGHTEALVDVEAVQ